MLEVIFALGPIFLLILLGYLIKAKGWIADSFWAPAELLTYYVFFPALLLRSIANAELSGIVIVPMAMALLAATILVAGSSLWVKKIMGLNGPAYTSLFQGTIRPNTYVGVATALAVWGKPGLTLVAVAIAFVVPTVNILSVTVMETYGHSASARQTGPGFLAIIRQVFRNPLVLACAAGALVNVSGAGLPEIINPLFEILGRAALPIGLLAVGAGLDFAAVHAARKTVLVTSVIKLALLPFVTWLCCGAFGVEGITRDIAVVYSALPVSASSYVLARKMGGDAELMAGIITFSTLAAVLTLPLVLQAIS